jgi:hypothetical protein
MKIGEKATKKNLVVPSEHEVTGYWNECIGKTLTIA